MNIHAVKPFCTCVSHPSFDGTAVVAACYDFLARVTTFGEADAADQVHIDRLRYKRFLGSSLDPGQARGDIIGLPRLVGSVIRVYGGIRIEHPPTLVRCVVALWHANPDLAVLPHHAIRW